MTVSTDQPADLVLRGGRIATMDAARSWASALAVTGGRIAAVGPDAAVGRLDRAVHAGHRAARPDGHAGLPGRPCPSRPRRPVPASLRAPRPHGRRRATSGSSPSTRRPIRTCPGSAAAAGTWPRSLAGRRAATILDRLVPDRPVMLDQPRRPQRLGQQPRARDRRDHRSDTPDPDDGRIERDPDGTPSGTLHEGRHRPRRPLHARRHAGRPRGGAAARPGAPASRWGSRPGRTPSSNPHVEEPAYVALAVPRRADGSRRRRPVVGPPSRRRADRRARRAAGEHGDRPLSADQRQADDGRRPRELHGADARVRISTADGNATGQSRPVPDRPGGRSSSGCRSLDALGFQPHFHAIGDRAVRESPRCRRGGAPGERPVGHATAHLAHPGHPSRRHPALPHARRRRQCPAVLGGPRGPDGRADHPVHRRALALAVPVPLAARGRRGPGHGLGLERVHGGPAAGDGAGRRTAAPSTLPRARNRSCRTSGSSSSTRSRRSRAARPTSTTSTTRPGTLEVGKLADLAVLDRDLFDRGAGRDRRDARRRDVRRGRRACTRRRPRGLTATAHADSGMDA